MLSANWKIYCYKIIIQLLVCGGLWPLLLQTFRALNQQTDFLSMSLCQCWSLDMIDKCSATGLHLQPFQLQFWNIHFLLFSGGAVHMPQLMRGGQRTALWSWFSPSISMWNLVIKLMSSGFGGKCFYLPNPVFISIFPHFKLHFSVAYQLLSRFLFSKFDFPHY